MVAVNIVFAVAAVGFKDAKTCGSKATSQPEQGSKGRRGAKRGGKCVKSAMCLRLTESAFKANEAFACVMAVRYGVEHGCAVLPMP